MNQSEINKLYKSVATDFKIVSRKTELWDILYCYQVLHDIKSFLTFSYIETISLILNDSNNTALKVKKYITGYGDRVRDDRPGNIDWEDGEGHNLVVHLTFSQNYINLNPEDRNKFIQENMKTKWYPSNINYDFPHLLKSLSKMYTYNNGGIDRIDFN